MRTFLLRAAICSCLLASSLPFVSAQTPAETAASQREAEHQRRLERLYPSAVWVTLRNTDVPSKDYQQVVNQAAADGIPRAILHEVVAIRAMRAADVRSLEQLLPSLKKNFETYRPETSIFSDPRTASYTIKTIERILTAEKEKPGTLAEKSVVAKEKEVARTVRDQLNYVESLVEQHAIAHNVAAGGAVSEDEWRKQAAPDSRWAKTNTDEYGSPIGAQVVDQKPTVPKATYEHFKTIVEDSFWAPYPLPN